MEAARYSETCDFLPDYCRQNHNPDDNSLPTFRTLNEVARWGFCSLHCEGRVLLGCYTEQQDYWLPTFRGNVPAACSRVQKFFQAVWPFETSGIKWNCNSPWHPTTPESFMRVSLRFILILSSNLNLGNPSDLSPSDFAIIKFPMRSTYPADFMLFGPIIPTPNCEISKFQERRMEILYLWTPRLKKAENSEKCSGSRA